MGMPREGQTLAKQNEDITPFVSHTTCTPAMMKPPETMRELGFPHLAPAQQVPSTSASRHHRETSERQKIVETESEKAG